MRNLTETENARVQAEVDRRSQEILAKGLSVAIVGPTGAGKTTLINAITGAHLPTDDVRPCTTQVSEPMVLKAASGQKINFCDTPGFHEGVEADGRYLTSYTDVFQKSDVVVVAIQADNRAVGPDVQVLHRILDTLPAAVRKGAINKLTFAQFKCELPSKHPAVYAKEGDGGFFALVKPTEELLAAKGRYFADQFLKPFAADLESRTYVETPFTSRDARLVVTDKSATFHGYLDDQTAIDLKKRHPDAVALIDRLADNHIVTPISARFKLNLARLLTVAVSRGTPEAAKRLSAALAGIDLTRVPFATARTFSNIVVVDRSKKSVLYDLGTAKI
jgi:energy-coupling factor transporter ATP-binding protein EcfA2